MAISKKRKEELVAQYIEWMNRSQAFYLTEYIGLSMADIDVMRHRVRETGGEFHVIKNTLGKVAFDSANLPSGEKFLENSTAILFAFQDPPALAKILSDFARDSEFIKVKGGYLNGNAISADQVKALADLPPLPVMRAQLLGTIMAPASRLARVLAEPARQLAAVLQSYAEKEGATA